MVEILKLLATLATKMQLANYQLCFLSTCNIQETEWDIVPIVTYSDI